MNEAQKIFKQLCLGKLKWLPSDKCYSCHEKLSEGDFKIGYSYWQGYWVPLHEGCSTEKDIIACQTIDADCNDCKHFQRWESEGNGIFSGYCNKFNKEVKAYPNFCSGHECFEHRKL